MALMIPTHTGAMTPGERRLYAVLRDALPAECVARYEVLVGFRDRRPDFTVADPGRGVCVLEVKDWVPDNLTRLSPDTVWVRNLGSPAPKPLINPHLKCQVYQGELREQLAGMVSLRDEKQHLKVPVEYFLVFPNMSREDFTRHGFGKVIPPERVLFRQDLENNGAGFVQRYAAALPVLPEPLSYQQIQDITVALDPTIVLARPVMEDGLIAAKQDRVSRSSPGAALLSLEQEEIAKSLGEGPRLLRGIAGTGKTMILLYRAKLLAANDPKLRILVLCWNTALATYMRQAYEDFPFAAQGEVTIKHFSEFVRELLHSSQDLFRSEDAETFAQIHERLKRYQPSEAGKFDAIYVDEAQDFRKEWIEFLFAKMVAGREPKERNFIIAADDAQRIYHRRDFTWESLDFKFTGRSKVLKTIFRNSARVWYFSAFLLEEKAAYVQEPGRLNFASAGKYEPLVLKCADLDEQIRQTVQMIKRLTGQGFAARNVLILYRHKVVPWLRHYPLVDNLTAQLSRAKIPWSWISQDAEAKRSFDWGDDTVKISTVHSAKGMDSPVVIILGVETFRPPRRPEEQDVDEVKLLYVGMTRAREFLAVLYSGSDGLVENLHYCEQKYEEYRDAIIEIRGEPDA